MPESRAERRARRGRVVLFLLAATGLIAAAATFHFRRSGLLAAAGASAGLLVGTTLGWVAGRRRSGGLLAVDGGRLRELLDALPVPMFVKDTAGVYRSCNQAFANFLVRRREEIVGRTTEDLVPRELSDAIRRKDTELLARPGAQAYDCALPSRNGSRRTVVFHSATFPDGRGRVEGIVGSLLDVTELKRAEERGRDAEEKLRAVLGNAGAGVAFIGPDMTVLSAGARMKAWFPLADSAARTPCYRVFQNPPRDSPCPACPVRKALEDGGVHEATTENTVAGEVRSFRVTAAAVRDEAGRIAGAVELADDITPRKRAEEEIRRLTDFNRDIVETMLDGLVISDAEGVIKFVNPPAAQMLGYTPFEMIGRHSDLIIPEDQRDLVRRADERRLRGRADRYELDLQKKSGERLSVLVSGVPRTEDGRFAGTLGVFSDISERKNLEREIRELSLRDELTKLLNRRGFFEIAPQTIKYAERLKKRLVLLYADVDDFKDVNDRLGHQEGDRILVDIGLVIKKAFREYDLVARFGGDEFVILAMESSRATPRSLRERLEERVDLYNGRTKADRGYRVALSIGVAIWDPEFPAPLEDLISQADARMYEDKNARKVGARARRA